MMSVSVPATYNSQGEDMLRQHTHDDFTMVTRVHSVEDSDDESYFSDDKDEDWDNDEDNDSDSDDHDMRSGKASIQEMGEGTEETEKELTRREFLVLHEKLWAEWRKAEREGDKKQQLDARKQQIQLWEKHGEIHYPGDYKGFIQYFQDQVNRLEKSISEEAGKIKAQTEELSNNPDSDPLLIETAEWLNNMTDEILEQKAILSLGNQDMEKTSRVKEKQMDTKLVKDTCIDVQIYLKQFARLIQEKIQSLPGDIRDKLESIMSAFQRLIARMWKFLVCVLLLHEMETVLLSSTLVNDHLCRKKGRLKYGFETAAMLALWLSHDVESNPGPSFDNRFAMERLLRQISESLRKELQVRESLWSDEMAEAAYQAGFSPDYYWNNPSGKNKAGKKDDIEMLIKKVRELGRILSEQNSLSQHLSLLLDDLSNEAGKESLRIHYRIENLESAVELLLSENLTSFHKERIYQVFEKITSKCTSPDHLQDAAAGRRWSGNDFHLLVDNSPQTDMDVDLLARDLLSLLEERGKRYSVEPQTVSSAQPLGDDTEDDGKLQGMDNIFVDLVLSYAREEEGNVGQFDTPDTIDDKLSGGPDSKNNISGHALPSVNLIEDLLQAPEEYVDATLRSTVVDHKSTQTSVSLADTSITDQEDESDGDSTEKSNESTKDKTFTSTTSNPKDDPGYRKSKPPPDEIDESPNFVQRPNSASLSIGSKSLTDEENASSVTQSFNEDQPSSTNETEGNEETQSTTKDANEIKETTSDISQSPLIKSALENMDIVENQSAAEDTEGNMQYSRNINPTTPSKPQREEDDTYGTNQSSSVDLPVPLGKTSDIFQSTKSRSPTERAVGSEMLQSSGEDKIQDDMQLTPPPYEEQGMNGSSQTLPEEEDNKTNNGSTGSITDPVDANYDEGPSQTSTALETRWMKQIEQHIFKVRTHCDNYIKTSAEDLRMLVQNEMRKSQKSSDLQARFVQVDEIRRSPNSSTERIENMDDKEGKVYQGDSCEKHSIPAIFTKPMTEPSNSLITEDTTGMSSQQNEMCPHPTNVEELDTLGRSSDAHGDTEQPAVIRGDNSDVSGTIRNRKRKTNSRKHQAKRRRD